MVAAPSPETALRSDGERVVVTRAHANHVGGQVGDFGGLVRVVAADADAGERRRQAESSVGSVTEAHHRRARAGAHAPPRAAAVETREGTDPSPQQHLAITWELTDIWREKKKSIFTYVVTAAKSDTLSSVGPGPFTASATTTHLPQSWARFIRNTDRHPPVRTARTPRHQLPESFNFFFWRFP